MNALRLCLVAVAACLLLGCQVSNSKRGNGDNVQVNTPFGDMHIKTNNDANVVGIGLTTYPGAVPVKEQGDKDKDAADINLNFGDFHLGVKAASFQTGDATSKVEAFYRRDLARYGDVLKCEGDQSVGQPARTAQGLTCSDKEGKHKLQIEAGDSSDEAELRAGSPEHMHIVGIEPKNGGTRIGLVALDLPGHHDQSDSE